MWIRDRCYETALVVSAFTTFVISAVLCFIGHPLVPRSKDIFPNQQVYGPAKTFFTQVEPPVWVHVTLWIAVFVWQLIWLIYGILTIFRKGIKENIFCSPGVVPFETYIIYIFTQIMQVAWVLFLDVEIQTLALLALALLAFSLCSCLGLACKRIANVGSILNCSDWNISRDLWLTLILVHNGLGLYAAWTSVATLFSFGDTLHLAWGVAEATSVSVALALLIAECIIWVIVDLLLLDKYTRYLLTPYIVVPFALIGSLISNVSSISNLVETNSILIIILFCLSGIFLLVKIMVLCVRHIGNYNNIYDASSPSRKLAYVANDSIVGTVSPKAKSVEDLVSPKDQEYVGTQPDIHDNINRKDGDNGLESLEPSNTPLGSMREGVILNQSTGEVEPNDVEYIYVSNVVPGEKSAQSVERENSLQRPLDIKLDNGQITSAFADGNNETSEVVSETASNVDTLSYYTADEQVQNDGYDTISSQTEYEDTLEYSPIDESFNEEDINSVKDLSVTDSEIIRETDSVSLHSQASTLTLTNVAKEDADIGDRTLADSVSDKKQDKQTNFVYEKGANDSGKQSGPSSEDEIHM